MTKGFDRGASIAAVVVAALMNTFLGFSQCGGYLPVERAVTCVIVALVVTAIGYRIVQTPSGSWGRRFLCQVPFGVGAVVVLALGFKVGEALYMPPHSLHEWLTLGC